MISSYSDFNVSQLDNMHKIICTKVQKLEENTDICMFYIKSTHKIHIYKEKFASFFLHAFMKRMYKVYERYMLRGWSLKLYKYVKLSMQIHPIC